ncbi:MAG: metalloregulator ArsR/SmtB family transcription factor [Rickettsiales bacterium]|nr:metalloregulator ArsR/SmtB family transcription factor [Rickettsiales bacterium]
MLHDFSQLKQSAYLLKTLGNVHRLQIITHLLDGEKNVTHINAAVHVSQPALSQHLARLRSAGILGSRRDQRQIYYYVVNHHVATLLALLAQMGVAGENKKVAKQA